MDLEIKVISATEAPEIELASATEGPEIDFPPLFKKSYGCIFRASAQIKYGRESDFEPKLVSIGPYYRGRENLKRMEDIKVQCMSDILNMRPDRESNIHRMHVEPFTRFERHAKHARRFYKEKFDLNDVQFVEMLVLDSFFVIRILLALYRNLPLLDLNMKAAVSDLLLLENQIPLFFIEQVYSWLYPDGGRFSNTLFHDLIRSTFMQLDLPWWINFDRLPRLPVNPDHLLHLYWKISEESIKKKIKEDHANPNQLMIKWAKKVRCRGPSRKLIVNATELHQMAGIRFENVEIDCYNGGCVEFSKGIMRMPCLKIDSNQTTLLVNLIAFENSMLPFKRTISTYMKIMNDLIDSDKDVEFLQKSRVVYNTLSSHTMASTFFNDIGDLCLIDYDENPFSELFEDVNEYYNSSWNRSSANWNRSWANLGQNYFNSLWAGISVFAGVTLLFLSGVQTYYTVFPKN